MKRSSSTRKNPASAEVASRGAAQGGIRGQRPGPTVDVFETEAGRIADAVRHGAMTGAGGADWSAAASGLHAEAPTLRRAPDDKAMQEPQNAAGTGASVAALPASVAPAAADQAAGKAASEGLLTEDDAPSSRGRMHKDEFLDALRAAICAAVDDALSGSGRDSQGCPWIDHWLDYYRARSPGQVEAALQRYAPEARGAPDAASYIRLIAARVGRSARTWAATGAMPDLPQDRGPLSGFAIRRPERS